MDAFEELVADCVASEGHWVRTKYKVALSPEDKIAIDTKSSPRWELDVVAYSPIINRVRVIECKSYLDSGGVNDRHFDPKHRLASRYKLFTKENHWPIISSRLLSQLEKDGQILANATVELYLAFGKARNLNSLSAIAADRHWQLITPDWLRWKLQRLSEGSWENTTSAIVAKVLLRDQAVAAVCPPNPFPERAVRDA